MYVYIDIFLFINLFIYMCIFVHVFINLHKLIDCCRFSFPVLNTEKKKTLKKYICVFFSLKGEF